MKFLCTIFGLIVATRLLPQLPVARDTIMVLENNYVLKMPWANGINYVNASNMDVNGDNVKDLVLFDRINRFGIGRFRCFVRTGPGASAYRYSPDAGYYFPHISYWGVLHDYDGDGKEDLFCAAGGGITVYRNLTTAGGPPSFTMVKPLLYSDYTPGSTPSVYNLYASSVGLPGFADTDNDGDLDILSFSPSGISVEFHRNMSVEKYGHNDSLVFQREESCWGHLSENNCNVDFSLCGNFSKPDTLSAKPMHSGACLTCFDSDGDIDQDVILGDISCNTVNYVHNTGSPTLAAFSDTTRLYPNYPAKNTAGTYIKLSSYPCGYLADIDGDGRKDLLASPNTPGSENYRSLLYYRNTSLTSTVNFQFQKNNFLQDEMIEVGQNSYPVIFDYDGDGKKDLLIGTGGYNNAQGQTSGLTLYRNTGTLTQPAFSLITRNYCGIATYSINQVAPAAGDVDNDGDIDICIGNSTGQIHWLENTAGAFMPCSFAALKLNPFSFTTTSAAASPQIFDLDNDGKNDLLVGMKNGNIAYYRNTGTVGSPSFSLVSSAIGSIDVKGDPIWYTGDGYAVPYFFREGSNVRLLVGSVTGRIYLYSVPSATAPFILISGLVNNIYEGGQSSVAYEDVNNDGKRDLFVGNAGGGLSFFSSASPYVAIEEVAAGRKPEVFPNPVSGVLHIKGSWPFTSVTVSDVLGQVIIDDSFEGTEPLVDLSNLSEGIYIIRLNDGKALHSFKILKE
jgi:hypothetical protein